MPRYSDTSLWVEARSKGHSFLGTRSRLVPRRRQPRDRFGFTNATASDTRRCFTKDNG